MNKLFWNTFAAIAASLLLTGNVAAETAAEPQPTAEDLAKMEENMRGFKEFAREQAPAQICAKPNYLSCFQIEQAQCIAEIKSVTALCLAKSDEQFRKFTSPDQMRKYVEITSICTLLEHGKKHGKTDQREIMACVGATPPAPAGAEAQRKEAEAMVAKAKPQLRKNAAYTLCDQPGYLACFKQTHEQCIAELSKVKDKCVDDADATFKDFPNRAAFMPYMAAIGTCLSTKHIEQQPAARRPEILNCVNSFDLDPQQMDKSLAR